MDFLQQQRAHMFPSVKIRRIASKLFDIDLENLAMQTAWQFARKEH
jgi:hypothetical protein